MVEMRFIRTMEFYSAVKINEIMKNPGKWVDLKNVTLNEVTWTLHVLCHMWIPALNVDTCIYVSEHVWRSGD